MSADGAPWVARVRPPEGVRAIARRLEEAGYEAWCVGGAVRDAILGHDSLDWDLATSARPEAVRALFKRTVPKGIEFGTVGVFDQAGVLHEVTTFRRDVHTDGRHAVVDFGASLDDDLARRDFTINAVAYRPADGTVADPFDGAGDAARRLVRAVGDPDARMREDRLRALRAIRFASRFDFVIEPVTWDAIVASGPHLGRLSPERVREELEKMMRQVRRPSEALERWRAAGALRTLVPALAEQPPIAFRTADCLASPGPANRPQRQWLRMAAPWLGLARAAVEAGLRALRASNQQTRWTADVTSAAAELGPAVRAALTSAGGPADGDLRRWAARAGRLLAPAVFRLLGARFSAERDEKGAADASTPSAAAVRRAYRRLVRVVYRDPIAVGDLAVGGGDLIAAGVPPGPAIAAILSDLLDAVLDDPARNTRDHLLGLAAARAGRAPDIGLTNA